MKIFNAHVLIVLSLFLLVPYQNCSSQNVSILMRQLSDGAKSCSFDIGGVAPNLKWHWNGFRTSNGVYDPQGSRYFITYSSPLVADLDRDGTPEIISIVSTGDYNNSPAALVVLNNAGEVLFNSLILGNLVMDAINQQETLGVLSSTTPAVADLDKDGIPEIIVVGFESGFRKVYSLNFSSKRKVFPANQSFNPSSGLDLWVMKAKNIFFDDKLFLSDYSMPTLADLDLDGDSEVIIGNSILDKNLNLKSFLKNKSGVIQNPRNFVSSIADFVKSSPGNEIAYGKNVFSSDGTLLFIAPGFSANWTGFGDIDQNGNMDLIAIGSGQVSRINSSGQIVWEVSIPTPAGVSAGGGGAPNIGKFDKNQSGLQIGTAAGHFYAVINGKDGSLLWKTATDDTSSLNTGSTIFDLNGDGEVEVLYNDEEKFRIYNGKTGTVIWETVNKSGTLWEYPVIANLNNDNTAQIIMSAPGRTGADLDLTVGGIKVFEDPSKKWMSSRKLWNQYSYAPEYISDNLSIVSRIYDVFKTGYRVNEQRSPCLPF